MHWTMKDPAMGDMIRVELGGIYHYGIYVSDDEVIQFGLAPNRRVLLQDSQVQVLASDIDTFLAGGFLEVCQFDKKERKKHRKPQQIVDYARSKLGMRGYNILYNNCEHFANECVSGEHISRQAEDVRAWFRKMPLVDVYLAALPQAPVGEPLNCSLRQQELDGISNEQVRREKYYAWKLLEYGLFRSLGLKTEKLQITKKENGQYVADKAYFSISHSANALAVAVSRSPVGVDIEPMDAPCKPGMAERILHPNERIKLQGQDLEAYFISMWTAKEALFKASGGDRFEPAAWDTTQGGFVGCEKTVAGRACSLSVATDMPEKLRIFENIQL